MCKICKCNLRLGEKKYKDILITTFISTEQTLKYQNLCNVYIHQIIPAHIAFQMYFVRLEILNSICSSEMLFNRKQLSKLWFFTWLRAFYLCHNKAHASDTSHNQTIPCYPPCVIKLNSKYGFTLLTVAQ